MSRGVIGQLQTPNYTFLIIFLTRRKTESGLILNFLSSSNILFD